MLPLWREQIRIALSPDQVLWVRLSKGLRRQVTEKVLLQCNQETSSPGWRAPLAVLAAKLNEAKPERAEVVVILSNHFVRYTLLPWSEKVESEEEEEALARICFEKIYGHLANAWALRISPVPLGSASLASAIDQALLDELNVLFESGGSYLASIQPYLMASFNYWRRKLKPREYCFVLAENGRLCVAAIRDHKWLGVRTLQSNGSLASELPQIVEREILLLGLEPSAQIYLYAPGTPDLVLDRGNTVACEILKLPSRPGFSSDADCRYGMALTGAI